MSKHTPGPWIFTDCERRGDHVSGCLRGRFGAKPATYPIFQKRLGVIDGAHTVLSEADAALIAAAPDLLSIVQRFVALPGGAWHVERHAAEEARLMQDARAVIAKAEGTNP